MNDAYECVIRSGGPASVTDGDEFRSGSPLASHRANVTTDGPVMRVEFSKFGNWYPISSSYEGRFLERVAPGAFTETIRGSGSRAKVLFNHGKDGQIGEKPLGVISRMEEHTEGTYSEVALLDTSYVRDLLPGLQAGVFGSSFMFNVEDDEWDYSPERSQYNPGGLPERTIRAVKLLEFGPVTWPANPEATAGLVGEPSAPGRSAAMFNDPDTRRLRLRYAGIRGY